MFGRLTQAYFALALSWLFVPSVYSAAPFYEGKTIKLIVGFSAGGGFDTYSRVIATPIRQTYSRKSHCRRREHDGSRKSGRGQSRL